MLAGKRQTVRQGGGGEIVQGVLRQISAVPEQQSRQDGLALRQFRGRGIRRQDFLPDVPSVPQAGARLKTHVAVPRASGPPACPGRRLLVRRVHPGSRAANIRFARPTIFPGRRGPRRQSHAWDAGGGSDRFPVRPGGEKGGLPRSRPQGPAEQRWWNFRRGGPAPATGAGVDPAGPVRPAPGRRTAPGVLSASAASRTGAASAAGSGGASCQRATARPPRTRVAARVSRAPRQRRLSARASSRAQHRAGKGQTAAATPAIQKPR